MNLNSRTAEPNKYLSRRSLRLVVGVNCTLWLVSIAAIICALAFGKAPANKPSLGDVATLLFAASSLALIIFSLFAAFAAVVGWQTLKENVKKEVEETTLERIKKLEQELRGRVLTLTGYMIGDLHAKPESLEQEPGALDYFSEAVSLCERGYDLLKGVDGNVKLMALNNIVYYACLHGGERSPNELLEHAQTLKRIGMEFHKPDYTLTYCRVMLQFGTDPQELTDALSRAKTLCTGSPTLTPRQMKEARFYQALLDKKIAASTGSRQVKASRPAETL